jgi:hypothetical protein
MSKETNFLNSFLEQAALAGASSIFPPALLLAPAAKAAFGGAFKEKPEFGLPVSVPGGDVKYTLEGYGPQSGESYKKVTGEYPKGYEPAPKEKPKLTQEPILSPPSTSPPYVLSIPAPTGGSKPESTISQTTDKLPEDILGELRKVLNPQRLQEILDIQNKAAIERSVITSALAREQTKELTARKIEEENIRAWKEARVAQINANAIQAASLASIIGGSFQINPAVMSEAFKASLQPITLTRRT